jgi:hypothetical protein
MSFSFTLPDRVRCFHDYFKMKADTVDILQILGYSFEREWLSLKEFNGDIQWIEGLRDRLVRSLPHVNLSNEQARREFMIATVLQELTLHLEMEIRTEYSLEVTEILRGTVDYLLQKQHRLLVIEAKQADMTRGMTQLAVELIAFDKWLAPTEEPIYGAISIGESWRFAVLHRVEQRVVQDLNLWRVPEDLDPLIRRLIGILE